MTTERIDIVVSERGGRVVKRSLDDIGASADRSGRRMALFGRLLQVALAGATIRAIQTLGDEWANLTNKIRDVTRETGNFNAVQSELFNIARDTRTGVSDTADLFDRLESSTRDLGLSQRETLTITENLNRAFIVAGAGAAQARTAIDSLLTGIARNEIGTREITAFLRSSPILAEILADHLGVTTERLIEMGREGEITGETILRALGDAGDEIEERFNNTVETAGQAFGRLRDNLLRIVGIFSEGTGFGQGFVDLLNGISDILEHLATSEGPNVLDYVISLINELGVVVGNVVGPVIDWFDNLGITVDDVGNAFGFFVRGVAGMLDFLIKAVSAGVAFMIAELSRLGQAIMNPVALVTGNIRGPSGADAARDVFNNFGSPISDFVSRVGQGARERAERRRIAAQEEISDTPRPRRAQAALNEDSDAARAAARFQEFLRDLQAENELLALNTREREIRQVLLRGEDILNRQLTESERARVQALAEENQLLRDAEVLRNFTRDLEQENILLQLNTRERVARAAVFQLENQLGRSLTETEREHVEALIEQNRQLAIMDDVYRRIRGPAEDLQDEIEALNALLAEGSINADEYARAMRSIEVEVTALDRTISGGFLNGVARINEEMGNIADVVSDTFVDAFDNATDALTEFIRTGRLNLRTFFDDIVNQITRLFVQRYITAPLFNSIGGLLGGAFKGFQSGGDFMVSGQGGIDSQLVAFRASPGERVTISRPSQAGPGGGGSVQMNIYTQDANSFRRSQDQILSRMSQGLQRATRRNK